MNNVEITNMKIGIDYDTFKQKIILELTIDLYPENNQDMHNIEQQIKTAIDVYTEIQLQKNEEL